MCFSLRFVPLSLGPAGVGGSCGRRMRQFYRGLIFERLASESYPRTLPFYASKVHLHNTLERALTHSLNLRRLERLYILAEINKNLIDFFFLLSKAIAMKLTQTLFKICNTSNPGLTHRNMMSLSSLRISMYSFFFFFPCMALIFQVIKL